MAGAYRIAACGSVPVGNQCLVCAACSALMSAAGPMFVTPFGRTSGLDGIMPFGAGRPSAAPLVCAAPSRDRRRHTGHTGGMDGRRYR